MMFWIQLAALLFEILKLILTRPQTTQVALNENVADLRKEAVKTRDLSRLRAFRDRLKNGLG